MASSDDKDEIETCPPMDDVTFSQKYPKHKLHSDFFEAVKRNDIAMVTEFLKNPNIDVHFHDKGGMQVLFYATQLPTTDVCKMLLAAGADVNAKNLKERTPLHCAALTNAEMCKVLLDAGAKVDIVDFEGDSAMHFAAMTFNIEALQLLFDKGAKVDVTNKERNTPLHMNVFKGCDCDARLTENMFEDLKSTLSHVPGSSVSKTVRFLIDKGVDINGQNKHKDTPLCIAARRNAEAVKVLIAEGADMDIVGCRGDNPLSSALAWKKQECFRVLLEAGANIHIKTWMGSLLCGALSSKEALQMLIKAGSRLDEQMHEGETALHLAAWFQPEGCKVMLDAGARFDIQDQNGEYPVHYASRCKTSESLQHLLDKGAAIDVVDRNGEYPVHYASRCKTSESLQHLLDKGAAIDVVDLEGKTPAHVAAEKLNPEVLQLLIDKGADVNTVDKKGMTPLHSSIDYAGCFAKPSEILNDMSILLNAGADIEFKNNKGMTPLHSSIASARYTCMSILLDAGADIEFKNNEGFSPLHAAVRVATPEPSVLKLLVERGADMNAIDKKGLTPLHHAALLNTECVRILLEAGADITIRAKSWLTAEQLCLQEANKKRHGSDNYQSESKKLKPVRLLNHDVLKTFRAYGKISRDKLGRNSWQPKMLH